MGSFSRLRYVIAANVNSLLEKAEDPEKLLRSLIRDMEDAAEDSRLASSDLLAEKAHLQRLKKRFEQEIKEWSERAEKAVKTGRDELARTALKAKADLEPALRTAKSEAESLDERSTQLEFDVATLKNKLSEAKSRLKDIQLRRTPGNRKYTTPAHQTLSPGERKMRRAMGRFDRLQAQVEKLEARVQSYEFGGELHTPSTASQLSKDPEIEAELEQLKARLNLKNLPTVAMPFETPASNSDSESG